MMRGGYWIVAGFAAFWASAGLLATGYPPATVLAPLAISAALLAWAYRVPGTAGGMSPHARTVIRRWSIVEGVAFVVAVNVLHHLHRPEAIFPVAALIVGAHFVPLARGIPVPLYYVTGAGLMLIGLAGLLVPAADRPLAVGFSAAAVLWGTAVYRLLESRRPLAV